MTCYEIQKYGRPEGLQLVDRPLPEPGDLDVVVRIRAASLNYRDLVVLRGEYDRHPVPGRVPLSDGAGEVLAVGPSVTKFKVGELLTPEFRNVLAGQVQVSEENEVLQFQPARRRYPTIRRHAPRWARI